MENKNPQTIRERERVKHTHFFKNEGAEASLESPREARTQMWEANISSPEALGGLFLRITGNPVRIEKEKKNPEE